jgi:hypothetical protein
MSLKRHKIAINKIFKKVENPTLDSVEQQAKRIQMGNNANKSKRVKNIQAAGGPAAKRRIEVKRKKY